MHVVIEGQIGERMRGLVTSRTIGHALFLELSPMGIAVAVAAVRALGLRPGATVPVRPGLALVAGRAGSFGVGPAEGKTRPKTVVKSFHRLAEGQFAVAARAARLAFDRER